MSETISAAVEVSPLMVKASFEMPDTDTRESEKQWSPSSTGATAIAVSPLA